MGGLNQYYVTNVNFFVVRNIYMKILCELKEITENGTSLFWKIQNTNRLCVFSTFQNEGFSFSSISQLYKARAVIFLSHGRGGWVLPWLWVTSALTRPIHVRFLPVGWLEGKCVRRNATYVLWKNWRLQ